METRYLLLVMEIPGHGSLRHLAEILLPTGAEEGLLMRILELDEEGTITGAGRPGHSFNLSSEPNNIVPHPDSYQDNEDLKVETWAAPEFEALWAEACIKWPALN